MRDNLRACLPMILLVGFIMSAELSIILFFSPAVMVSYVLVGFAAIFIIISIVLFITF